jgi:hypothetical protein
VKSRYLGRGLIAGDGLRHLIEGRRGAAAIQFAEMDRHRIVGGWRSRLVTYLLHIVRPRDREGLSAPNAFKQGAIRPLRSAVHGTRDVGEPHFDGIGRGSLRLLGRGITQSAAGRTHVPEIAADEIALAGIVMQHGCKRRIGVRLRLAVAESCAHRTGIGTSRPVQFRNRTGETRFGHVAKSTSFIAVH